MQRWPHWTQGLAVAGLLLLLGLLAFLFTRPTPGTEVTVVPTPTTVVVVLPTTTPVPQTPTPIVVVVTATPVPQTPTPLVVVVTPTPAPAAPPPAPPPSPPPVTKPGPSAEVQAYLDASQPKLQRAREALQMFSEQSNRLVSDPALLGNQAWQSQMTAVLATLRATGVELQATGPVPEAAAPLDATLKSIGRDLVALADEYASGIDAQSVTRVNAALQRMQAIGPKFEQAAEQAGALAQGG